MPCSTRPWSWILPIRNGYILELIVCTRRRIAPARGRPFHPTYREGAASGQLACRSVTRIRSTRAHVLVLPLRVQPLILPAAHYPPRRGPTLQPVFQPAVQPKLPSIPKILKRPTSRSPAILNGHLLSKVMFTRRRMLEGVGPI